MTSKNSAMSILLQYMRLCQFRRNPVFPAKPVVSVCFLYGSEEFIRPRVEGDVAAMQALKMDVTYISALGYAHDFRLWNHYLELALDRLLPLKRCAIDPETK